MFVTEAFDGFELQIVFSFAYRVGVTLLWVVGDGVICYTVAINFCGWGYGDSEQLFVAFVAFTRDVDNCNRITLGCDKFSDLGCPRVLVLI